MTLERSRRLRDSNEWRQLRRRGEQSQGPYAVIYTLPGGGRERIGFSTTSGFRRAVDRNRARRRLREAFMQVYRPGRTPRMVAAVAKREALHAEFEDLKASVGAQLADFGLASTHQED